MEQLRDMRADLDRVIGNEVHVDTAGVALRVLTAGARTPEEIARVVDAEMSRTGLGASIYATRVREALTRGLTYAT